MVAPTEVITGESAPTEVISEGSSPAAEPAGAARVAPSVSLSARELPVGADEAEQRLGVTVRNRSESAERVTVEVSGLPEGWGNLSASDFDLEAGASNEVTLRVRPRAGRRLPAGRYPFIVRASLVDDPDASEDVSAALVMEERTAFDARIAPLQAQGCRETFKVTLSNTGSVPLSLWLEGSDPAGMCRFDHPPPSTLEPGADQVVRVRVGARRSRLVGSPKALDFSLRVLPAGEGSAAARNFEARLVHQPYLSQRTFKWSLLSTLGVILTGLALTLGPSRIGDGVEWTRCRLGQLQDCPTEVVRDGSAQVWPAPDPALAVGLDGLAGLSATNPQPDADGRTS
jgi:hypothetical protein